MKLPRSHQTTSISIHLHLEWNLKTQSDRGISVGHLLVIKFPLLPQLPSPPSGFWQFPSSHAPRPPAPAPSSPSPPPSSLPVDAASCLVRAGALEQSVAACNASCLSQTAPVVTKPIWQCGSGYTELTERITLLDLDFTGPFSNLQGKSIARFALPTFYPCQTQQGLAHT